MPTIKLDDTPFEGRISTPPRNREVGPRGCRHCGSQLAGRYVGVRFMASGPCGSGPAHAATIATWPWRPPLPERRERLAT
jgi:hypothetical protein